MNFLGICRVFPFSFVIGRHSFKDKADRLEDVNAGLLYPMLMAFYFVVLSCRNSSSWERPVATFGEMARDVGAILIIKWEKFFVLPQAELQKTQNMFLELMGYKMSKSRGNIINIFLADKPFEETNYVYRNRFYL